ncbi:MAG: hypothetical protein ACTSU6_07365 [Candidatus Njordarchaeales archaeon]
MILLIGHAVQAILSLIAIYFLLRESFRRILFTKTFAGLSLLMVAIFNFLMGSLSLLASLAPTSAIAETLFRASVISGRLSLLALFLTFESMRNERPNSILVILLSIITGACVTTYLIIPMDVFKSGGVWNREIPLEVLGTPIGTIDGNALSILSIFVLLSALYTTSKIIKEVKTPEKKRNTYLFVTGIAFAIIIIYIMIIVDRIFGVIPLILGLRYILVGIGIFITVFAISRGLYIPFSLPTRLLGLLIVDKSGTSVLNYGFIKEESKGFGASGALSALTIIMKDELKLGFPRFVDLKEQKILIEQDDLFTYFLLTTTVTSFLPKILGYFREYLYKQIVGRYDIDSIFEHDLKPILLNAIKEIFWSLLP